MKVKAAINTSTSSGEEIARELENQTRHIDVSYHNEDCYDENTSFTHEEFVKKVKDKFTETYGVNFDDI